MCLYAFTGSLPDVSAGMGERLKKRASLFLSKTIKPVIMDMREKVVIKLF